MDIEKARAKMQAASEQAELMSVQVIALTMHGEPYRAACHARLAFEPPCWQESVWEVTSAYDVLFRSRDRMN